MANIGIQKNINNIFGLFSVNNLGGQVYFQMNGTNNSIASSFVSRNNEALNEVRLWFYAVYGTQANRSCSVSLYSDVNGGVGSVIETKTITNFTNGRPDITGFTTTLTAGVRYWIVVKNTASNPATDSFDVLGTSGLPTFVSSQWPTWGEAVGTTTDGSTWTYTASACVIRLRFSSGDYWGWTGQSNTAASPYSMPNYNTYDAHESGMVFTSSDGASMNIVGVGARTLRVGNPTGNLSFRIYDGANMYETNAIPAACVTNAAWINNVAYFTNRVTLSKNSTIRVVLHDTSTDTASNYYAVQCMQQMDTDPNSMGCLNTLWTYTSNSAANPIVWTDSGEGVPQIWIILDSDLEFNGSGGGLMFNPGMNGNIN